MNVMIFVQLVFTITLLNAKANLAKWQQDTSETVAYLWDGQSHFSSSSAVRNGQYSNGKREKRTANKTSHDIPSSNDTKIPSFPMVSNQSRIKAFISSVKFNQLHMTI